MRRNHIVCPNQSSDSPEHRHGPRRSRNAIVEAIEARRLLAISYSLVPDAQQGGTTLLVTSDDNSNDVKFQTDDQVNLLLSDRDNAALPDPGITFTIPLASFDRIDVRMGGGHDNYVNWVDGCSSAARLNKPATIDVGGLAGARNIMFFFTPTARLSGDGRTGAQYNNGTPGATTVTWKNAAITSVGGGSVDVPAYFDCSAFTGNSLSLGGGDGNDTFIGGTGNGDNASAGVGTQAIGGGGNDTFISTGGHFGAYGGPGNDTYVGGPDSGGGMFGEDGDDVYIHGTGAGFFDGGPGNDTAYASATDGADALVLGTWPDTNAATYVFFDSVPAQIGQPFGPENHFYARAENVNLDALGGVDDGIIPAAPGTPYPDVAITGLDASVNLRVTHLEPTVNAGPDAGPLAGGDFAAIGSFRDIGDPGNAWTATVDYGDGTAPQPLSIDPTTISTPNGPAHPFSLNHEYLAIGTYTVTVRVTDSEGDVGSDTLTISVPNVAHDQNVQGLVWTDFNNDGAVDFGESGIAGVPITLANSDGFSAQTTTDANGLYTFNHVPVGVYRITEGAVAATYVQGKDTLGSITDLIGNLVAASVGDNSVQDVFSSIHIAANQNAINYNFGEQPAAGSQVARGQAATIGFWQNKNGQALINRFSSIGSWLAATLPNSFSSVANSSSQQVATLYQQKFVLKDKLDAQFMATALNVYASSASLGATDGTHYGFTVTQYGLSSATWNVGSNGAAFGVANNSTLTVLQLLQDADGHNILGITDSTLRKMALNVFGGINAAGAI